MGYRNFSEIFGGLSRSSRSRHIRELDNFLTMNTNVPDRHSRKFFNGVPFLYTSYGLHIIILKIIIYCWLFYNIYNILFSIFSRQFR